MTGLVWWTVSGLVLGLLAPPVLRRLIRAGVDAAVLLNAWAVTVSLTLTAVALPALAALLHRCWLAPLHAGPPGRVNTIAAALSAAAVSLAVVRGGWSLLRTSRQRRRLHGRHTELTWLLTGRLPSAGAVLWLPAAQPLAYSLGGNPPMVVMSTGLQNGLDPAAVRAVAAHEHAHIGRRHHRLMAIAYALSAGLGWLPLMRRSPSLVRTLTELDADAVAARTHGAHGLRQALRQLQYTPAPATALGIANESTRIRLARLSDDVPVDAAQSTRTGAAGGAVLILGAAAMLCFVALVAVASCTGTT